MLQSLVNNELKGMWKVAVLSYFEVPPRHMFDREGMGVRDDSFFPNRNITRRPQEYDAEMLPTQQRRSKTRQFGTELF